MNVVAVTIGFEGPGKTRHANSTLVQKDDQTYGQTLRCTQEGAVTNMMIHCRHFGTANRAEAQ